MEGLEDLGTVVEGEARDDDLAPRTGEELATSRPTPDCPHIVITAVVLS